MEGEGQRRTSQSPPLPTPRHNTHLIPTFLPRLPGNMEQHIALELLVVETGKRHGLDGWISDGNECLDLVNVREVAGPGGDLGEDEGEGGVDGV